MNTPRSDCCGYEWPADCERVERQSDRPMQQSCCIRDSVEDTERCVWHADLAETDEKMVEALADARVSEEISTQTRLYDELLDGAVLRGVQLGNIDFGSTALRGADLSGVSLRDADLSGANLYGADLSGAFLPGANLSEADLLGADLSGAVLRSADLSEAFLSRADLSETDLEGAALAGAMIESADFSGAFLKGANLLMADSGPPPGAYLGGGPLECRFSGADLGVADLSGASLWGADLSEASLQDTDLCGTDLRGADLSGASLQDADFSETALCSADLPEGFVETDLPPANLQEADLSGADLRTADLSGADLFGTDLSGASLWDADLTDANLRSADLSNVKMIEANLSNANLIGTSMEQIDLRSASLTGVAMEDTTLVDADLRHTDLNNARLYQAILENTRIGPTTDFGDRSTYEEQSDFEEDPYNDIHHLKKAEWVYRHLQSLYQGEFIPERVSHYYFRMKESQRKHAIETYDPFGEVFQHPLEYLRQNPLKQILHDRLRYLVLTADKHLMGYGQNPMRLIWATGMSILIFGLLYPFFGGISKINRGQSIDYSLTIELSSKAFGRFFQFKWIDEIITSFIFSINQFTLGVSSFGPVDVSAITGQLTQGKLEPASGSVRMLMIVENVIGAVLLTLLSIWILRRASTRLS